MKRGILTAAICTALLAAPAASSASAFRSIEILHHDGTATAVNLSTDMHLRMDATQFSLISDAVQIDFDRSDVKGWQFSTAYVQPEPVEPPEPPIEVYDPEGDGTWQTPFNAMALRDYTANDNVWVTGYIVGTFTQSDITTATFTNENCMASNLLLAPSPEANHHSQCVGVMLPTIPDATMRDSLNLVKHPEYLGREISIMGTVGTVGGEIGIRFPGYFKWGPQGYDIEAAGMAGVDTDAMQICPAQGSVTVTNIAPGSVVALYDINGRAIATSTASDDATVDISSLPTGIYILSINGKSVKISVK